ncbi:hypothetical protein [Novosphingopyxis sp. YJ-S2-01]|uniref:hypothetical protein n=1 Tax=Novosphingopyxis sp. YJ-S2-01 TaxID=2794021 RepID=UPI0018DCF41E|nr:hypothetical protein [Novosphingopyxis sp. YJ-S2-01]MBH9537528.1 hypothetical protein [Novosphingopyxis sp. YJ-S2-01]
MMLSLAGAAEQQELANKRMITGAWLAGRLGGMADPKTYPTLESLLGDMPEPEPEELEPEERHVGAKLWVMLLNRRS